MIFWNKKFLRFVQKFEATGFEWMDIFVWCQKLFLIFSVGKCESWQSVIVALFVFEKKLFQAILKFHSLFENFPS